MIYQMEADLRFPRRAKIGTRAVGWLEKEVNAAYSGEVDRPFRRNVTGDSAESAL
jgi:predicted DNA-binding transcriptional regulator AlpA